MKITALATAALAASTIAFAPSAKAGGCYVSTASMDMNNMMAGGATLQQAYNYAHQNGSVDGTDMCWTKLKGYVRQMNYAVPYLHRAIWS